MHTIELSALHTELQTYSPTVWYSITSAASELSCSAARLIRSKSRACTAARSRSRRYLRSTLSMKAERERLDPANRSILVKTSLDSVIDVFSFILLLYHSGQKEEFCRAGYSTPPEDHALERTSHSKFASHSAWFVVRVIHVHSEATVSEKRVFVHVRCIGTRKLLSRTYAYRCRRGPAGHN